MTLATKNFHNLEGAVGSVVFRSMTLAAKNFHTLDDAAGSALTESVMALAADGRRWHQNEGVELFGRSFLFVFWRQGAVADI